MPVRITWYDDRIEFLNPGGPYGAVTHEFRDAGMTDYRNPNLAEAMRVLGLDSTLWRRHRHGAAGTGEQRQSATGIHRRSLSRPGDCEAGRMKTQLAFLTTRVASAKNYWSITLHGCTPIWA